MGLFPLLPRARYPYNGSAFPTLTSAMYCENSLLQRRIGIMSWGGGEGWWQPTGFTCRGPRGDGGVIRVTLRQGMLGTAVGLLFHPLGVCGGPMQPNRPGLDGCLPSSRQWGRNGVSPASEYLNGNFECCPLHDTLLNRLIRDEATWRFTLKGCNGQGWRWRGKCQGSSVGVGCRAQKGVSGKCS